MRGTIRREGDAGYSWSSPSFSESSQRRRRLTVERAGDERRQLRAGRVLDVALGNDCDVV
eukprot:178432-Rhodomonas_salina.1